MKSDSQDNSIPPDGKNFGREVEQGAPESELVRGSVLSEEDDRSEVVLGSWPVLVEAACH